MPTSRAGIAGAVFDDRLYVFGGEGNPADALGVFDDTEVYDPVAGSWEVLEPMLTPRHGMGAAAVGSRIWVPGGGFRENIGAARTNEAYVP
jgi:N-acetylneuraminic acid mutarotase